MNVNTERRGLTIDPITGFIGAEVGGVDIAGDIDESTRTEIYQALLRWKVLVFRDQAITPAHQIKFGGIFGRVGAGHAVLDTNKEHPEILEIGDPVARQMNAVDIESARVTVSPLPLRNLWHSDMTFLASPPSASVLRGITIPPYGGDTHFANTETAYANLSDSVKAMIDPLKAVHNFPFMGRRIRQGELPVTVHPVVRVHPDTGERAIFVNPNFTSHIVGATELESRHILGLLYEQIVQPEWCMRVRWQPGTVVVWDNRSTCHRVTTDYRPDESERYLHRIVVEGDRPRGVDGFESYALAGGDGA